MSVKSDPGKFEEIEGQYFIRQAHKDPHKGVSVDKMRPNTKVIRRWTELSKEEKDIYNKKAGFHGGVLPGEKEKETKDIPLPALKKFALEVAPDLKKKKPYLSLIHNRGQLNRIIIDKWLKLSFLQQNKYRAQAGLPAL